jgi:O-methyltransferase
MRPLDRLRRRAARARLALHLARHPEALADAVADDLHFRDAGIARHEMLERKAFLRRAFTYLAFNGIPGDYAEFGCHGAMTFRLAWSANRLTGAGRHLWAFDSFAGLPPPADPRDRHPRWQPGTMAQGVDAFHAACRAHGMAPDDYTVVAGYYSDTLAPGGAASLPERIALAYIDCDLYSSTAAVLAFLRPRLHCGMLIAFDDWFCYSDAGPSGERAAAAEAFSGETAWRLVPYQPFGWHGMAFVVEPAEAVPPGP